MILFSCPKCGGMLVDRSVDTGGQHWRCSVCGLTDRGIIYTVSTGTSNPPSEQDTLRLVLNKRDMEIARLRAENERLQTGLQVINPVRHGVWVKDDPTDANSAVYCSDCHEIATDIGDFGISLYLETPYCPNCGAHMDVGQFAKEGTND